MNAFPVHADERGSLMAVEFDQINHPVVRTFVVTSVPTGVDRGHHPVPCPETVVLAAGSATFWVDEVEHCLGQVGERLELPVGSYVRYRLGDPASVLVVFAGAPYVPDPRSGE